MPLTIDEASLPATLTSGPLTDEQFAQFCASHPEYFIEMTADGELVIMPPNFSLTGARNSKICFQVEMWAAQEGSGICTDASTGFLLPNGSRRSPDAAWTSRARVLAFVPRFHL